jgi:hypothetical protein
MSVWVLIVLLGIVKLPLAALMLWLPFRHDAALTSAAQAASGGDDDGGSRAPPPEPGPRAPHPSPPLRPLGRRARSSGCACADGGRPSPAPACGARARPSRATHALR